MRKKLAIISLVLCFAITAVGCGSTKGDKDTKTEDNKSSKEDVKAVDVDNLDKYLTLGEYKGLEATKTIYAISDEDVQSQIDGALMSAATPVTDRPIQNGDIVDVDFTGTIDGVEFEGGKGNKADLTIGSHEFIEGFEEGLIGATKGQNLDVKTTFPDPYTMDPEKSGKEAVFNVTVNSISTKSELTDEWVAANTEYKTVDEYKTDTKKRLQENGDYQSDNQLKSELFNQVVTNSKMSEYPEDLVETEKKLYKEQLESLYSSSGMSLDDVIAGQGMTMEDFDNLCAEKSQERIQQKFVVQAIMNAEKMNITKADYDKLVVEYAEKYGYKDADAINKAYGEEVVKDNILWDKVGEVLVKNAKVTEKNDQDETSGTDGAGVSDGAASDGAASSEDTAGTDKAE